MKRAFYTEFAFVP